MVKITNTHGYSVQDLRRLEKNAADPAPFAADGRAIGLGRISGGVDALVPRDGPGPPTTIPPQAVEILHALESSPAAVGWGGVGQRGFPRTPRFRTGSVRNHDVPGWPASLAPSARV